MSYSAVGLVLDPAGFRAYVRDNRDIILSWARGVTIHHTGSPTLAQRPSGWTVQHMRNLRHFYQNELGWSSGPHLFTDDDQVFGLSPVSARGVHAKSFNATHIGIEALGNYDTEAHDSGRGQLVWNTTAQIVAILLEELDWDEDNINFHRDDPKTSKTCPGRKVSRDWFLNRVRSFQTHEPSDPGVNKEARSENQGDEPDKDEARERLDAIEWQVKKLRDLLE